MADRGTRPIVRDYALVCLAALSLLTLLLVQQGLGWWSVLPLAVGAGCVLARWSIGPAAVLLLLLVIGLLRQRLIGWPPWHRPASEPVADLLLAVSVLVYVAAHMRLLSLERHAVPPDVRRSRKPPGRRVPGRWLLPREATRRVSPLAGAAEIGRLLIAAPVFGLVATLVWVRLAVETPPAWLDVSPIAWQAFVVIWALALAVASTAAVLAWLGRMLASPEQCRMYLQDQLWAQTRGEQRRINRWAVWGRLRRQRKEGKA